MQMVDGRLLRSIIIVDGSKQHKDAADITGTDHVLYDNCSIT